MAKKTYTVKGPTHFTPSGVKTLLAALDERAAQIRTLEAEVQHWTQVAAGKDKIIEHERAEANRFKRYWDDGRLDVQKAKGMIEALESKLALCDGTNDREALQHVSQQLAQRDGQIGDMVETIARLQGWIDCKQGREPQIDRPDPQPRVLGFDPGRPDERHINRIYR